MKDQIGIELANVEYWSHIMRKRIINYDNLAILLNTIPQDKTMTPESQDKLGAHMTPTQFITTDDIKNSIQHLKCGKAPGDDGLPIELYQILCERDGGDALASWLQAVYVHSYHEKLLPSHMNVLG